MNDPSLTEKELQILREALREVPAAAGYDDDRAALELEFSSLRALLGTPMADHVAPHDSIIPPMPEHIRQRLEKERLALMAERHQQNVDLPAESISSPPAAVPALQVLDGGQTGQAGRATTSVTRKRSFSSVLALAAAMVVVTGLATLLLPKGLKGSASQPVFVWQNAADETQRYDVWVLPAEGDVETMPAVFVAKGVRSPVSLKDMQPGPAAAAGQTTLAAAPSRLLVCLASIGRLGGAAETFTPAATVTVTAPDPAVILRRLIARGRTEEARQAWAKLPPGVQQATNLAEIRRELSL